MSRFSHWWYCALVLPHILRKPSGRFDRTSRKLLIMKENTPTSFPHSHISCEEKQFTDNIFSHWRLHNIPDIPSVPWPDLQPISSTLLSFEEQNCAVSEVEIDKVFGFWTYVRLACDIRISKRYIYREWQSCQSFGLQCSAKWDLSYHQTDFV